MNETLFDFMIAQGYSCKIPSMEVVEIDAEVASKMICKKCNGSMIYEGYSMLTPYSYRAFAVCSKCDHWEEF